MRLRSADRIFGLRRTGRRAVPDLADARPSQLRPATAPHPARI